MRGSYGKWLAVASLVWASYASAAPVVVEDWKALDSSNTGTYADSNGSSVTFQSADAQKKGEKALSFKSTLKSGGYCGIWHTVNASTGKAAALVFDAKSDKGGSVQVALKDVNNVQYVSTFTVPAGTWTGVTMSLASFQKDPYYTPPDAVTGKPMDFSTIKGMNFSSQVTGDALFLVGPINAAGEAPAASADKAAAAPAAKDAAPVKPAVIEDWKTVDSSNAGTYADSNGSSVTFASVDGPKKGEKALSLKNNLKSGGYCGVWHSLTAQAGAASGLAFAAKSDKGGSVQIALKDVNNVQYVATFTVPAGAWTPVEMPFTSFQKDPYYTPSDAVTGKPMDFSTIKGFNVSVQTAGESTLFLGPVSTQGSAAPQAKTAAPAGAAAAPAAKDGTVIESWAAASGGDTGTYADSTGSTVKYDVADGPKSGEKALHITGELKSSGYLGIWHTLKADLSGAGFLRFQAKGTPGNAQIALKDKFNGQYIASFPVAAGWTEVMIPLSSFQKDPYYTPPDAVAGKPMDLSELKGMNFAPQMPGKLEVSVGPVQSVAAKK